MAADVSRDYAETQRRIANLPCSESSYKAVLKELARWNSPGEDTDKTVHRFLINNNLALRGPQLHNNPGMVLFRTVKNMINETDCVGLKKEDWNELDVPQRYHNHAEWRPLTPNDVQQNNRPLWNALQKCNVSPDRVMVGIPTFQHEAVYDVANHLQTRTHHPVSASQVELIIGKNPILRPLRQYAVAWRPFSTTTETRLASLWTLAAATSFWGLEFVDSFLEFCTAMFVGPICAVSREDCKEAFAACVAVATLARARAIGIDELRGCMKVWWLVDVLEKAGGAAQNTLLFSRYITEVTGKRVAATACNRWETPINPNLSPVYSFYVVGRDCGHPQNANQDGTFGVRCDGRFVLATKMEDFGEEKMRDGAMRVSLTHNNPQAANNILACLERRGTWAYVQGPRECLNCAYDRALRHGFAVIIDGPQAEHVTTTHVQVTNKSVFRQTTRPIWAFALLFTFFGLLNQVAAVNIPLYDHQPPYFEPNATCGYATPPTRSATSWSRLFGIIRALQSVILTIVAIRSGKRFVARSVFGLIAAVLSTLMTGFTGWILSDACAQYKSMAILKGFVTAAVNRVAFEMIDVVCMIVSLSGLVFGLFFPLFRRDFWALLQYVPLGLVCMSAMYIWRWYGTGMRMATSRGVVGEPVPLLASHIVALILAVVAFVFTTEADNKAGAASYVSDGLMMGEVFLQYIFLK